MRLRALLAAFCTTVALITASGCVVTLAEETSGAGDADGSAITDSVRARLDDDRTVDASAIVVATQGRAVLLTGSVRSAEEAERAEDIAVRIKGVDRVDNRVAVRR